MQTAVAAVVAAILGIIVGYFLRNHAAQAEKAQARAQNESLDQRMQEQAIELSAVRSELARSQAESNARAGFEAQAAERLGRIRQLETEQKALMDRHDAEVGQLRTGLQAAGEAEKRSTARISQLEAELRAERAGMAEKIALLESAKETLANQFQALAAKILEEKSKSFSEGNQKEIRTLIDPLREKIDDFRKKVEEAQSDSKTGVTKLETLIGSLNSLNQQLSEEARNLATALRGNTKAQGDWGEFILRDLLEKAGLREGEEYSFQQSFPAMEVEGERIKSPRTDVIVSLPGGRHLVIDSKVSLNAYTDAVNAASEEARKLALAEHIRSVRKHIATLSRAGYHHLPGIESPDFVVLFVPIEPAFLAALQGDAQLWADAYQQGILLVGPTTLLYVIRIVTVLWQQEMQSRNVQDVMNRGAELYDKFVGFVEDLQAVGRNLRSADQSYSDAMKKLSEGRGNLVRQVEMLKALGVSSKSKKSLPKNLLDAAEADEPVLQIAASGAEEPSETA
jgi:DNA recombination protein RmuC